METVVNKQSQAAAKKISLYPILSVNFVGTLGFSIVLPFLVFLVTRFGGNAVIYGVMGATYSVFQLIGAPILGKWSDRYGRRKILLLSQLGTLFSWLVFLLALYLPMMTMLEVDSSALGKFTLTLPLLALFFARAFDGITGGNVSVANAYLADITDEDKRSENFGKMAVAANLGFVLGPAMAGLLGATMLAETLPVLAAVFISIVASLIIALKLPESQPSVLEKDPEPLNVKKMFNQEHKECINIKCRESIPLRKILRLKNIAYLLSLYGLIFLGFSLFHTSFPVHAVKALNWKLTDTGTFFSFIGIMMALSQGPVLSRATKIWSDGALVVIGSIILTASFVTYLSTSVWLVYLGAVLLSLGNGLMWSAVLSLLSKVAVEKYQGQIQGVAGSCGSFASIIGLILGGLLYEEFGAIVFIFSAAIIFIVFLMSIKLLAFGKGTSALQTD